MNIYPMTSAPMGGEPIWILVENTHWVKARWDHYEHGWRDGPYKVIGQPVAWMPWPQ